MEVEDLINLAWDAVVKVAETIGWVFFGLAISTVLLVLSILIFGFLLPIIAIGRLDSIASTVSKKSKQYRERKKDN